MNVVVDREKGFEPSTSSLARKCSTAELLPVADLTRGARAGAEGQNRTGDTSIFSAVLYRLSYLGSTHNVSAAGEWCQGSWASHRRSEILGFHHARKIISPGACDDPRSDFRGESSNCAPHVDVPKVADTVAQQSITRGINRPCSLGIELIEPLRRPLLAPNSYI